MPGNSFGTLFKFTSFGESHGPAIGGILEGCPAGLDIDPEHIQAELNRRRPGQSSISSERNEEDKVEFLSGIFEGKSTGTPIAFLIRNKDQRSADYDLLKETYRPSHADFTYEQKYGHRDHRGGGRSSARETAGRVVAGAIAKLFLANRSISVNAFVKQIGPEKTEHDFDELDLEQTEKNMVRCPDQAVAAKMIRYLEDLRIQGDTAGGIIQCVIRNLPAGLGEPVFDKLHALLGHAMLSINAVKGFEIGSGFASVNKKGSELNDAFFTDGSDANPKTRSNNSGGIQGGISNGMPVYFNVAFKPVASVKLPQNTVDRQGRATVIRIEGRHDPCVVPRAVPIVEAMAAIVISDLILLAAGNRI